MYKFMKWIWSCVNMVFGIMHIVTVNVWILEMYYYYVC